MQGAASCRPTTGLLQSPHFLCSYVLIYSSCDEPKEEVLGDGEDEVIKRKDTEERSYITVRCPGKRDN